MAKFQMHQRVQPPSIVHPPVPLSMPPSAKMGAFFDNGRLSWSLATGNLYITNTATGQCLHCWAPSRNGYNVTIVQELRGPKGSLLVVALEGCGQHLVGVLSSSWGKLVRGISIPSTVTALHPFNCEGFSWETGGYSHPDLFPNSILSLFNGIVAVGTVMGHVYLVDLQLGTDRVDSVIDCLESPLPLCVIEGQVTGKDLANMSDTGHVTVEVSKGNFQKGRFMYQQSLPIHSSTVTSLYFAPRVSGLFIGYSFGGFHLYDVSSFQLLHTCALSNPAHYPTVTHFTYVEPENDPRNFVYVWVVRASSPFARNESTGSSASLHQMVFSDRVTSSSGLSFNRGFKGCYKRFELPFVDDPGLGATMHSTAQVLQCTTMMRHHQEHPSNAMEFDLSRTVFIWVDRDRSLPSTGGDKKIVKVFAALFDVNQWYHSQMPRAVHWKKKEKKHAGVFGCSYFTFYNLTSAFGDDSIDILDVLVDRLLPFHSHPPMPETFMWPSAAKFNFKILTAESSVVAGQCLGAQRMVLWQLDECRGSLYAQPEQLYGLCTHTELLPPMYDHTPSGNLNSQRAALLSVVVAHGAPTRILTAFADSWAGAGEDDPVISQWVEVTKRELEQAKEAIFSKCFSDDSSPIPPAAHWRKLAAIEVFLDRLLSRGFERVGKTGPLFEAVSQLYLTVARHKKVMEIVRFLNEQGLVSDYPTAALRSRYNKLRGGAELVNKLAVDCIIEAQLGASDVDSAPQYPPHSLPDFMEFLMTFDLLTQHCLVLYLLCDLGSLQDPRLSPHTLYARSQELPSSLVNTIHSLWLVDNVKFQDPAYQIETTTLFTKLSNHPLFPWQHRVVVERLLRCGEVDVALSYIETHGREMQGLEEIKLKLGVYVGNYLVSTAYDILKQFEGSENYNELFSFFLECCIEGKSLHHLLDLPFSPAAETTFVLYLENHQALTCREFLVFYFLLRHRFVEALAIQEKLRPFAKSDPDPNAMERSDQRDTLLAGLATTVPASLHHIKLTGGDRRSQSLKVKVQVEKSLSSVVAKAVKSGDLSGRGGAVYSLIQSIADKRTAPSEPITPLRPSKGSVTELSHTPFLSTPISVKKIRVPLTASRTRPLLTPTPRSRPLTPFGSHTHQRFLSHMQGFKDRMASMTESRLMEVSAVQTPSPMSAVQLIRPASTTPTSILKGSRPGSRLTDRKIRFAVDGSPSPEKEKQKRPLFTPNVPSSLSTAASVAMVTPLPVSDDDDDLYESPVESPSQLQAPTPSQSATHTPSPSFQTKLQFNDAEDSPPRQIGVATSVAMETEEIPPVSMETGDDAPAIDQSEASECDIDTHDQDTSIVEQDLSYNEQGHPSHETSESSKEPTNSSPLQDLKLTRDKLSSSISLNITPVSKSTTPAAFSSSFSKTSKESIKTPTGRLFASVTGTPASQLFSPVPYLSDLIQAKEKKLRTEVELRKQQDLSSIRTPPSRAIPTSTSAVTAKISQSFSSTMVPSVSASLTIPYNFTPPTTKAPNSAQPPVTSEEPEPMEFVFSPPLTRSAARRKRESVSRESSVEPAPVTVTPAAAVEANKKKNRGRPRKSAQPPVPSEDTASLVTPPTLARPLREPAGKQRTRAKPVKSGVASRRSARLLSSKK